MKIEGVIESMRGLGSPGGRPTFPTGTCKVCGKERLIDCAGYCGACYPWDESTDMHHKTEAARNERRRGIV